jgi:hypothetical protein
MMDITTMAQAHLTQVSTTTTQIRKFELLYRRKHLEDNKDNGKLVVLPTDNLKNQRYLSYGKV